MNKTVKREDKNLIDPRAIVVEAGFNSRIDFGDIDNLAEEIRSQGVLNPISVIPFKNENGEERYRLVDGERRYRAVMLNINNGIDISRVPALFLPQNMSKEELFIQQAMRNEGKNFNEYEWGVHTRKMMDTLGKTLTEVAALLHKNVGGLQYALQDLEYDERIQELLRTNQISGSNVRRVYSMHKGDEQGAIEEILGLKEAAKKSGKKKLSLADLDKAGKTKLAKDSETIKKGLECLTKYMAMLPEEALETLDPSAILDSLKAGEKINDILGIDAVTLRKVG